MIVVAENPTGTGKVYYNVVQNSDSDREKARKRFLSEETPKNSVFEENKSNNGKFDVSECAKNFGKGLLSPITAVFEHPIATIGMVGAAAIACTLVPVLGPLMAVGFAGLSLFQVGKGLNNVVKNYKNGNYDKAEQSFNEVGEGTIGVALSACGLKQSAKIAKEAKMMSNLGADSLTVAQKEAVASEVKGGSYLDALKEITSLFTSKTGLKAVKYQFKPSNITKRGNDMYNFLFKKEEVNKIKKEKMTFAKTPEGVRRAGLKSEDIEKEVNQLYKEVFDEYGVPEELRPKIQVTKVDIKHGGGYCASKHLIEINENAYREGVFDLPDIIKHEATHANEAILRQRLPFADKEKLTKEYYIDKIMNGDKENVILDKGNFLSGTKTMKPPKMDSKMKSDFCKLAQDKLYQTTTAYKDEEYTQMIKPLIKSNPEFVKGYPTEEDAIKALAQYAKSHSERYNIALYNSTGFNTTGIDTSLLKDLTLEEKETAIKSYISSIDCTESNAVNASGAVSLNRDFNQYQFTHEEVLAQKKGNNFEIAKLKSQLAKLRAEENYDLGEEARILDQIKKSELTIEYKTKGEQMYELYTQSLNNPEDKELAKKVLSMQKELNGIKSQLNKIDIMYADDICGFSGHMESHKYSAYKAKVRPSTGASTYIPYTTTVVPNILNEEA